VNPPETIQVIMPRKGVGELAKILEDSDNPVDVEVGANHIRITHPEMKFTSKLIDGKFPEYSRVIPKGADKLVVAEKDHMRQALARASILSNEKYRGIRLTLSSNLLQAQAHNPEMEEAEEEIEVSYEGESLVIGFNVNYILDAINAIDGNTIHLALSDSNSSCLVTPAEDEPACRYVIMPMRL
jgi:DNA polymerase-3 subunit beta